jgi:hypothetical protein
MAGYTSGCSGDYAILYKAEKITLYSKIGIDYT